MDCKRASNLMMAYMDDEIEKQQKVDLYNHFSQCIQCQEEFDWLIELEGQLKSLDILEPSEGFEEQVMNVIDLQLYKKRKVKSVRQSEKIGWRGIATFIMIHGIAFLIIQKLKAILLPILADMVIIADYLGWVRDLSEKMMIQLSIVFIKPRDILQVSLNSIYRFLHQETFSYSMILLLLLTVFIAIETILFKILKDE